MTLSVSSITYLAGIALIIISVVGGGLEVKEVKIQQLSATPRLLSFVCGCFFIAIGLYEGGFLQKAGSIELPKSEPLAEDGDDSQKGDRRLFSWFVQLASFPVGDGASRSKAQTILSATSGCGDFVQKGIILSADYENLVPGYLVPVLGPFPSSGAATAVKDLVVKCAAGAFVRMGRHRINQ